MKWRNSKRKEETVINVGKKQQGGNKMRKKKRKKRKKEATLEKLISMHQCDKGAMNGVEERRKSNEARMFL